MRLTCCLLCALSVAFLLTTCDVEQEFRTGDSVELRFGLDTLTFDTVFTARGSATRSFKVYNDADEAVMIDRISVAGMTGVEFTFNVDGFKGPEATDVAIFPNDSIFVFVEAEVDPSMDLSRSPFITEDRLIFETGNAKEEVVLVAFGQNANYINGRRAGQLFGFNCGAEGSITLPNDLPNIIYGSLIIDNCTLRALPGTEIYMHGGVQQNVEVFGGNGVFNDGFILTQNGGRLEFVGTREEPILIRVDRLEPEFDELSGAYRGLILGPNSRGNRLEHVTITNAIVGVTLDSLAEATISDSEIAYSRQSAINGFQSDLTIRNSLFHSNFGNAVQVLAGGRVNIDHTTVATFGGDARALVLTNFLCYEDRTRPCSVSPLRVRGRNSIFTGNRGTEVVFQDGFQGSEVGVFDVALRNSIVRTDVEYDRLIDSNFVPPRAETFFDCREVTFADPLFFDIDADDYRLDSLSVARNLGASPPRPPVDLLGNERDEASPDAGAYEWTEGQ